MGARAKAPALPLHAPFARQARAETTRLQPLSKYTARPGQAGPAFELSRIEKGVKGSST
jgi:hypothetical protein